MTIGKVIKQKRTSVGMTMRTVRERGGPTIAYQHDVESEKRNNVGIATFVKWCRAIGVSAVDTLAEIAAEDHKANGEGI